MNRVLYNGSETNKKAINNTIKEFVKLLEDSTIIEIKGHDNYHKINIYKNVISNELINNSNLIDICRNIKYDYYTLCNDMTKFIHNIKQNKTPETLDSLIKIINNEIKEIHKTKISIFDFYIPIRINILLSDESKQELNKLLSKSLNITIIEKIPDIIIGQVNKNNIKELFMSRLIVKSTSEGRCYSYCKNITDNRISTFLGVLALANNIHINHIRWSIKNPEDVSISENPEERILIVLQDNKIINEIDIKYFNDSSSMIGKSLWTINEKVSNNYEILMKILNKLYNCNNKNIREFYEKIIHLYLIAITEKVLRTSFLNFWIIIEVILKSGSIKKDKYIKDIIKKILNENNLNSYIENIYDKRNRLVHEMSYDEINYYERNTLKEIVDKLIDITLSIDIKNLNELEIYIEYIFHNKSDLKKRINIIRIIHPDLFNSPS